MSWRAYNDWIAEARDLFGLDYDEARNLYSEVREAEGRPLEYEDLYETAPEYLVEIEPEEDLEYDFEFDWDDEWLEEGEEIELSLEIAYEEGE